MGRASEKRRAKKATEEMLRRALACLVERAGGTVEIPVEEHTGPFRRTLHYRINPQTDAMEIKVLYPVPAKPANVN